MTARFGARLEGREPRIGILYPCSGTRDRDFWELAPPDASVHVTRLPFDGKGTAAAVTAMASEENLRAAAALVAEVEPAVVAWADTSGSFLFGPDGDRQQIEMLADATGAPATTTSTAIVEACRRHDLSRVDVASPYVDELNEALIGFLEAAGIGVGRVEALGLDDSYEIASVADERQTALVRSAAGGGSPAVLVPCTDFFSLGLVEPLEAELDRPVLAANAVTMWDALRRIGHEGAGDRRPGGRLYRRGSP